MTALLACSWLLAMAPAHADPARADVAPSAGAEAPLVLKLSRPGRKCPSGVNLPWSESPECQGRGEFAAAPKRPRSDYGVIEAGVAVVGEKSSQRSGVGAGPQASVSHVFPGRNTVEVSGQLAMGVGKIQREREGGGSYMGLLAVGEGSLMAHFALTRPEGMTGYGEAATSSWCAPAASVGARGGFSNVGKSTYIAPLVVGPSLVCNVPKQRLVVIGGVDVAYELNGEHGSSVAHGAHLTLQSDKTAVLASVASVLQIRRMAEAEEDPQVAVRDAQRTRVTLGLVHRFNLNWAAGVGAAVNVSSGKRVDDGETESKRGVAVTAFAGKAF